MYISTSLYDASCVFVDVSDKDFFSASLRNALKLYNDMKDFDTDANVVKANTPICHASTLQGRTDDDNHITRKAVHCDRARRKYIMIDADFNPGEEQKSEELIAKLKSLAEKHSTPLMIYPTVSYPAKPRFRAVLLSKRVMNSANYYQAIGWLWKELDSKPTDKSDFNMNFNRNLPVFINQEQVDAVYSTFDDKDLKPLDNVLWRDMPKPTKTVVSAASLNDTTMHDFSFDSMKLYEGAKAMSKSSIALQYETFWRVVASIAASLYRNGIAEETAHAMLDALAEAGDDPDRSAYWKNENRKLLNKQLNEIQSNPAERLSYIRPLCSYSEFRKAVK